MKFRVTAIGEILYDVYPDRKRLGGAPFNFIYHVWKILGCGNFISSVGNDENGNEMLAFLNSIGFETKHIVVDEQHPTGTVNVTLNKNKIPTFTICSECSYDYIVLNEAAQKLIEKETDLLYSGTLSSRNIITRETTQSLFGKKHLKYFCDLNLRHDLYNKELIEKTLSSCNILKINNDELEKLKLYLGLPQQNDLAIQKLFSTFTIDLIAVTLGSEGAELFNRTERNKHRVEISNVVDTLGAGDAFASVLCVGYLNKLPLSPINKFANEFASEICMIDGALPNNDAVYKKYRKLLVQ